MQKTFPNNDHVIEGKPPISHKLDQKKTRNKENQQDSEAF